MYTLWLHDAHGKLSATEELVINPEVFPSLKVGDLVLIWNPALEQPDPPKLLLQVNKLSAPATKGQHHSCTHSDLIS